MKRLILFLSILAVLLLTACNEQKDVPSVPETPPTTVNVKVDFSVYTPDRDTTELYTLFPTDQIKEFTPFTSPGSIYPFAGRFIDRGYYYHYSSYDPRYMNDFIYGFVDGSGTVVVDPIYTTVAPLAHALDYTCLPFWYMSVQYDSVDPYSFHYGLASMDGTFALPCRYKEILAFDDRIMAFYPHDEGNPASFEVYDFDGNLCFTSQDLPFASELDSTRYSEFSLSPYSYSEGLYTIPLNLSPERAKELGTERQVMYYMTEDGEFLYGPFSQAEPFFDGVAIVKETHAYGYTYLRRDGTLFSGTYPNLQPFCDGSAIVSFGDTGKLIDRDENVLLTAENGLYSLEDGSLYTYTYSIDAIGYDTDYVYTCYDRQGQILWKLERQRRCTPLSSALIQQVDIVNPLTGESASLPYDSAVEYHHSPSDPYIVVYSTSEPTMLLDKDLHSPAVDGYLFDPYYLRDRTVSIVLGERLAKGPLFVGESDLILFRTPGSPVGTYPHTDFAFAQIFPDQVVAITDVDSTYLYDAEGQLFFYFPLDPKDN